MYLFLPGMSFAHLIIDRLDRWGRIVHYFCLIYQTMATGDKSHWVQILTETNTGGAVQRARQRTKNQPLNAEPAGAENDALVQQVAHSTNASPCYSPSQKTLGW